MGATQTCTKLPNSQAQRTLARNLNIVPIISAGFAGNTKRPTSLSNIPQLVTNFVFDAHFIGCLAVQS
jgi:hypothetical protein